MPNLDIENQVATMLVEEELVCYHCGQPCAEDHVAEGEKHFCCHGCRLVHDIIDTNNLCEYYQINEHPGVRPLQTEPGEYEYLNDVTVRTRVLEFESADFSRVRFFVPSIHCSSCIWLLENLQKVDPAIVRSEVNFGRKTVCVDFNPAKAGLGTVAAILASLGYPPSINTGEKSTPSSVDRPLIYKLGLAGFCFGNVMLFSFPEYLGLDPNEGMVATVFSWLNLCLSVPVMFYSAQDYIKSALKSFRQRQINIDVPIAIGLVALFLRSTWDIVTGYGPGYLDSLTGLVFFLLVGRWFQARTYEVLSFERDFKSYFPLAVQRQTGSNWSPVVIFELQPGDRILIRNQEIVPADSTIDEDEVFIDYSFVTGEAKPVKVKRGDTVFAGGRVLGKPVELLVTKGTSQSHLTSLWNNEIFRKEKEGRTARTIDNAARKFTWIVLLISVIAGLYWYVVDPSAMWLILTSVLMVACPCALALAAPFTYGSMLRAFGRRNFYLKNAEVIERLSRIDAVVFDKTGTITVGDKPEIRFYGEISPSESAAIKTLTGYSIHPLSTVIAKSIKASKNASVHEFREFKGLGIEGIVDGVNYKIGSAQFTGVVEPQAGGGSRVFVSADDRYVGFFEIKTAIRHNIAPMLKALDRRCVALLSGDNEGDRQTMAGLFPAHTELLFNQQPQDKLNFIKSLQAKGKRVLMVGDGLNDAGALMQADVGIAVTDDTALFTPACDGILHGGKLGRLHQFLSLSRSSTRVLKTAFVISFCYNAIALSIAVAGYLTPIVAAVLMPVSSVSVVGFSTLTTDYISTRKFPIQP